MKISCAAHLQAYNPFNIQMRRPMMPANDSQTLIRAPIEQLRNTERMLLSELAIGDVNIAEIMTKLQIVRRSILAAKGQGILKFA